MVIFGRDGEPYFSTDTAAVLRALEVEAKVLLKATNVEASTPPTRSRTPRRSSSPSCHSATRSVNTTP